MLRPLVYRRSLLAVLSVLAILFLISAPGGSRAGDSSTEELVLEELSKDKDDPDDRLEHALGGQLYGPVSVFPRPSMVE